jgi:hypothetical protein
VSRKPRTFEPGELVEVRRLPGDKHWEKATYVRRIRADEMPSLWRGPLGHVVQLDRRAHGNRQTSLSGHRIRKVVP